MSVEDFFAVWFVGAAGMSTCFVAAILYRRRSGKPILRPDFPNARFLETWQSGRSLRNILTRAGSASRCLWIVVTDDTLRVGTHFPFSLTFLPDLYGYECEIDGTEISSVRQIPRRFGGSKVVVSFRNAQGNEEAFEVTVRNVEGFVRAIEEIRK